MIYFWKMDQTNLIKNCIYMFKIKIHYTGSKEYKLKEIYENRICIVCKFWFLCLPISITFWCLVKVKEPQENLSSDHRHSGLRKTKERKQKEATFWFI